MVYCKERMGLRHPDVCYIFSQYNLNYNYISKKILRGLIRKFRDQSMAFHE